MIITQQFVVQTQRGVKLSGIEQKTSSSRVIIMCHGFMSDKSARGIFDVIAQAFLDANLSVIRFDFSGCGESEDDTITIAKEILDLEAILTYVKSLGYTHIGLFGHSLGGLICCHALLKGDSQVRTAVLMAPVTRAVTYDWATRFTDEQLAELAQSGVITKHRTYGVRQKLVIDGTFLRERESVHQEELLRQIVVPICIVHGTDDERIPLLDSEHAMQYLPDDSRLEVIDGADHNFGQHLEILSQKSCAWFEKYLL
jgi:pimeloyl-ACP methyl ester carboxylesterase